MVVVPLAQPGMEVMVQRNNRSESEDANWVRLAAGAGLLAGGLLLLTGRLRAGLATAAAGAALAILDQQDTVKEWWSAVPGYIDQAQHLLATADATVAEVAAQRERLHRIFAR
jgi:hypothetical protein